MSRQWIKIIGMDLMYFIWCLGENQYWLMGDNRLNSGDSRMFGPVDGRLIHGRILFRIWSVDSNEDWWILILLSIQLIFGHAFVGVDFCNGFLNKFKE